MIIFLFLVIAKGNPNYG